MPVSRLRLEDAGFRYKQLELRLSQLVRGVPDRSLHYEEALPSDAAIDACFHPCADCDPGAVKTRLFDAYQVADFNGFSLLQILPAEPNSGGLGQNLDQDEGGNSAIAGVRP